MWKYALIGLGVPLLAACAAMKSPTSLECKDDSQNAIERDSAIPPPDSGIYGVPSLVEPSYRKLQVPEYPRFALDNKVTGTVYVHVWIKQDRSLGNVLIEQVYPRSAMALTEGLSDTIRTWQFNPAEARGIFIATEVIVPVKFSIKNHAPPSIGEPRPSLPENVFILETIEVTSPRLPD